MRLLFEMDKKDYGKCTHTFVRNSARSVIIVNSKIAMIHSLKYDYYKFPGGGIESGENPMRTFHSFPSLYWTPALMEGAHITELVNAQSKGWSRRRNTGVEISSDTPSKNGLTGDRSTLSVISPACTSPVGASTAERERAPYEDDGKETPTGESE